MQSDSMPLAEAARVLGSNETFVLSLVQEKQLRGVRVDHSGNPYHDVQVSRESLRDYVNGHRQW